MFLKNRIVLVTGGAGFIGSHIVDRALELGAEKVIAFDNSSSKKNIKHLEDNPRFEVINSSITDYNTIKPLIQSSDYVFHEAASKMVISLEKPRIDLQTNIIGTFNILEAARDTDTRIIHASTGSVFGSSEIPMKENHKKSPTTLYGISKLAAEKYCLFYAKEFGIKASVIRYFHVYGSRQDYSGEAGVVSIFLSRVLNNKPPIIFSGGNQIRCFTYISDDVDATLLLAKEKSAIGEDFNVASRTRMTINQLAKIIIQRYAKDKSMKSIMGKMRQGENMKPIPDTTKIEKLGFKAKVSFEEGLEKTKEWVGQKVN